MQPKLSFGVEPIPPDAPLAARMRPQTLDEFIGQEEAVGPGSMLRGSLERGRLPSFILWGPPGCGKTTLARIVARGVEAEFVSVSAVSSGVADLRRVVAEAQARRASGRRTVLFIDEIHRFNKAQQDVILPYVEDGTVTLIGATTENPSFEVIAPLLSRARVVRLKQLGPAELSGLVDRALADRERGLGMRELAIDEGGRLPWPKAPTVMAGLPSRPWRSLPTWRRRPADRRSPRKMLRRRYRTAARTTTARATITTTRSRRSSRRSAEATRTLRCTGSPG